MFPRPIDSILAAVGQTPLLKLSKSLRQNSATVFAKLEFMNPGGSVKDRVAVAWIEAAENAGFLKPDSVIVDAVSGNTAIGLAMVCAVKSYRLILVLPKHYSPEYRRILAAYGVELVLTDMEGGLDAAKSRAKEIAEATSHSVLLSAFLPSIHLNVHRETTLPEILRDLPVQSLDALVVGIGSGETAISLRKDLSKIFPNLRLVGVEFSNAWMFDTEKQGMRAHPGKASELLRKNEIDECIEVSDQEAFEGASHLAKTEGLLVGMESGAVFFAAREMAVRIGLEKNILVLLPDAGGRYFSARKFFEK